MPMTAEQAKAAATDGLLGSVQQVTATMANAMASGDDGARMKAAENYESHLLHLRQVEAVSHRIIDKSFKDPKDEPKPTEPDDDYRTRLTRVVGEASVHSARLQIAAGRDLDDIGSHYDTRRR